MTRDTLFRFAGFLLVVSLVVACRSPRRQWTPAVQTTAVVTTGNTETVTTGGVVASGSPREMLEQLDAVLRQQGFQPTGPVVHGSLPTHGLIAYAVDAQAGACYTLAVIGEVPGQNIDMIVLDPYGRPAAHNVRPDNHPWASFCAATAGRFIARVQMAAGAGGYFYAVYAGSQGRRMELSSFYGERPESTVQVAQMDAETQQRLGLLDQQLGAHGYTRIGRPAGMVLNGREPRDFQLNLRQGHCYAFATLGGPGAIDTDIVLNDSSGNRLEADIRRDRDALIRYCAPATGAYALSVRMYEGQGPLFAVGYVQNAAQGHPHDEPVMASTSTAHAGLDENFALLDADMRARGYESYGAQTRGELAQGGTRNFEIQLEGGRCYAILAVGDADVRDLDLVLLDANGREVDRDIAQDPRPTVRVCPETSGQFNMQVRMTDGQGSYVYAAYRWPRGTSGAGLRGLSWVRLSEVTALLGVEGFTPDAGFTPQNGQLRRQGATASHRVDLAAGQCYAIVVVGGDGMHDIDVTLSHRGTELASDFGSRNAFPSVRHCATHDGEHTVRITAARGHGRYYMQVFSRSEQAQ